MKDSNKPVTTHDCPKCGNDKAYGPEFRRGVGTDDDLGEHLRYYCTACRFMTFAPTKDQDTPMRRTELALAFKAHFERPRPASVVQADEQRMSRHATSYGGRNKC